MIENQAMGIIMPGKNRPLLGALLDRRTVGAIPFGGRYRLIDFMLSNMVHSGIWNIGIITRNKYESLMEHLGSGRDWDLARKDGGLTLLPPMLNDPASAMARDSLYLLSDYRRFLTNQRARYIVIAYANLVGQIDFDTALEQHIDTGADITVLYNHIDDERELGDDAVVYGFDGEGRVNDVTIGAAWNGPCDRSLGAIIIGKEKLLSCLATMIPRNQGSIARDLLQKGFGEMEIRGFRVEGYCRQIHDLQSYYSVSMELLDPAVRRQVFPLENPVLTRVRDEVSVKYGLSSKVKNSLVADGCIIDGEIENCILFRGVNVKKGARLSNCIIMQNSTVESNASLSYVITDRRCYIKEGRILSGFESYPVVIGSDSVV